MDRKHTMLAALAAAALLAAGPAASRNDSVLLPIEAALRAGEDPRGTMPLHFGNATALGEDALAARMDAHGVGSPNAPGNANTGFRSERRTDNEMCQEAFRKAVLQLQARARAAGGVAVVGIVGNYRGNFLDSPTQYECRVGISRAVVDLRGQAARVLPASLAR